MKIFIVALKVLLAIFLITAGCSQISQPSNLRVLIGVFEILLAIILLYSPLKSLIKQFI
ncbi:hypothetical protein ACFSJU_18055 [Paradesertivirga mongoliensis]|uniref:Lipoprotein n=1 Tax=Paradesertivirga mongoliensis TaxID=2100740 RepID=A0ABW4ZQA8_9SPHI|nr:hypothetical protein [Pedobacter mongoliensis]